MEENIKIYPKTFSRIFQSFTWCGIGFTTDGNGAARTCGPVAIIESDGGTHSSKDNTETFSIISPAASTGGWADGGFLRSIGDCSGGSADTEAEKYVPIIKSKLPSGFVLEWVKF